MVKATLSHDHSDIPEEIDFSDGERGKFYRENARLRQSNEKPAMKPILENDDIKPPKAGENILI